MTDKARIEKGLYWDRAWSLVEGCTPVSEGCQNCWSARQTHMRAQQQNEKIRVRYTGLTDEDGAFNGSIRLIEEAPPLRTKKPIVWAIWNDLFHEDVPFVFIHRVWDTMKACPQHTFLVLTKRPYRMLAFTQWMAGGDDISIAEWPRNCWLGVTAENQKAADERIPILLQIPAAVRFVSVEPMLGPISFRWAKWEPIKQEPGAITNHLDGLRRIDWIICGGESGPEARPMHPDWARNIREECQEAGVPFFFKQHGEWLHETQGTDFHEGHKYHIWSDESESYRVGKKVAGRLLDGRAWDEFPREGVSEDGPTNTT